MNQTILYIATNLDETKNGFFRSADHSYAQRQHERCYRFDSIRSRNKRTKHDTQRDNKTSVLSLLRETGARVATCGRRELSERRRSPCRRQRCGARCSLRWRRDSPSGPTYRPSFATIGSAARRGRRAAQSRGRCGRVRIVTGG